MRRSLILFAILLGVVALGGAMVEHFTTLQDSDIGVPMILITSIGFGFITWLDMFRPVVEKDPNAELAEIFK